MCVLVYLHKCAVLRLCIFLYVCVCPDGLPADRAFPGACQSSRVAFPYWLLSLLSEAVPPPHHISLCQFTSCRRIEPQRPKLHVPIINTYNDTCCFSPRLNRSAINSYFGTSVNYFFKKGEFQLYLFLQLMCFILLLLLLKECDVASV